MIEHFCEKALDDIAKYKHEDKEEVMINLINERLNKSFDSYQADLESGLDYLKRRNELNLIRKMNKLL